MPLVALALAFLRDFSFAHHIEFESRQVLPIFGHPAARENAVAQAKICWTDFYEFVPGLFTGRDAHERGLIAKSDCHLIAGGCGDDHLASGRLEVSDDSN